MAAFDAFEDIQPSNHTSFDEVDDESYSNFGSYPTAAAAPGEFSGGDVSVDHASASTDVFGFGSDAVPNYSHQSPFGSVHADNGNGSNEYNGADDGFFVSDGPILPPPTEMEPEDGFALREWRR
ncbi:CLATHRIN LIGHT CHAIN, partial [Salix purpurea]